MSAMRRLFRPQQNLMHKLAVHEPTENDLRMEETMMKEHCSFEGCYQDVVIRNLAAVLLGKDEARERFVFRAYHACREHVWSYSHSTGEELYQREKAHPSFHMFFLVTREHLALARRLWIVWYDAKGGAPGASITRPYGDSSVISSIAEIIGYRRLTDEEWCYSPEEEQYLEGLHREMHIVLQIILHTGQMQPGVYKKPRLTEDWVAVSHPEREPELVLTVSAKEVPQPCLTGEWMWRASDE
jgi:hypothetical protein